MRELTPAAFSVLLHASVAWAALQVPQYSKLPEKTGATQELYTLDFLPAKESTIIPFKKQPKKIKTVTRKKKTRKANKKKILITQEQKSPVKISQGTTKKEAKPKATNKALKKENSVARDGRLLQQQAGNPPPEYPVIDRIRKNTGRVTVLGFVNKAGKVSRVQITKSTGTYHMNSNAIKAFSSYKFQKGQEGWVKMPFEYTLDGRTKVISIRDRSLLNDLRSL